MKNLSLFFALVFIMFSCNGNNKSTDEKGNAPKSEITNFAEEWVFDTLRVEKRAHIDNDTTKEGMLVNVEFIYPTSAQAGVDLEKTQRVFAQFFAKEDEFEDAPSKTFEGMPLEAFNYVLDKYQSIAEEYAEEQEEIDSYVSFNEYQLSKINEIECIAKHVVSFSTESFIYSGGSHGGFWINYCNVDLRNGSLITEKQLFKLGYKSRLAAILQQKIIDRNNSADEDKHIALHVEISDVEPNQNFCFTKEGIMYGYNPYEIAPYVQGSVELIIPYKEIRHLIKRKYIEIIDDFV